MKYFRFLLLFITMIVVGLAQAQTICVYKNGVVIQECKISEVDSVVYKVPEPSNNVLIGDICLGAKPSGSPLNDINSILSEDVVRQNISKGNLREFVLTEKLSEVLRSETNSDGVLEISQWRTMKFQTSPTSEAYSYHGVLIPSSLANEYIGVFVDGMNYGTSFDLVIPGCTSITNKTITYNGIEYTIFAYYVANTYMKDAAYVSTIIKK